MTVRLSDFDFHLPPESIARYPLEDRPAAKLLVWNRQTRQAGHRVFRDLPDFLKPGDLLVLNDTRVIPARLLGTKKTGGKLETFLVRENPDQTWHVLLKRGTRLKRGALLEWGKDGLTLQAELLDDPQPGSGERTLRFLHPHPHAVIEKIGHMPIPPYLGRDDEPRDRTDYQTVFARKEGAVAAPTAGLHFDEVLLKTLEQNGIEICRLTLHVGYGTFQTITEEELSRHEMFKENYEISEQTAAAVNRAKQEGRRVVACGTTAVRALESSADREGHLQAGAGETQLFIYPPFPFKITGALITNFHLPKSSLLLLVAAFMGREDLLRLYQEAIQAHYRFYSYGDAMLCI